MQLPITNPELHTLIIILAFFVSFILTFRKRNEKSLFSPNVTAELKGFAILTIVFGHIGYFLDSNNTFLYPLSIASGVGVNLFLFLSGYGLTKSTISKALSPLQFYKKRLLRIYIPMWIVITLLLILDSGFLGLKYDLKVLIKSYLGFFPVADIYASLNSVLWYFTFIVFYYLIYPILTFKKLLYISPLIVFGLTHFMLKQDLPIYQTLQDTYINKDVLTLYKLHIMAFPLGMFFALLPLYVNKIGLLKKPYQYLLNLLKNHPLVINVILIVILLYIFSYTALNSKVGESKFMEQLISNITMLSIVLVFILKRFEVKILTILGIFSYEIYLLHWPLVYRYDFLYQYLPASLATILYIGILLGLGFLLQKLSEKIAKTIRI